ncbi:MAG: alpha/beta fold hydrolase, partial [Alphaproteobacteria bacterium]|nr:alpha/beta fold hydrolase [Alphaproteobacteria bacterium]
LKGLQHMLTDLSRGQLSHVDPDAFEVGVNIATTPGKVIHETDLYQLIQYTPTTKEVLAVPLLIFPPWINRFYILDLNPAKSFVAWAVEQGLSVFMVSWKSADASMKDVVWDDYIAAQVDAIDTVRAALDVPAVHTIGYCVAGTTLAATLAILAANGEAERVKSVTFFTAQVDFEQAGDLKMFVDDSYLALLEQLSAPGYLDGRYMAATFNSLRGRDLIWNYVVSNYLLGNDYPPFDLLYWNGDTTNLPAKWHRQYLVDLYRDNRMVIPNSLSACGTPIDLRKIETPAYIQAGREDHIAPLASVWRLMDNLSGPKTFLLAGSGHIAGVVNPPAAGKYQYWTGDSKAATLDEFIAGASETKGSWWPHWIDWIAAQDDEKVAVKGARIPGKSAKKVIEDAPGRYVKQR